MTEDAVSLAGATWLTDPAVQAVLAVLNDDGGAARIAGGAVRNALLGETIADIDIATTLLPGEVARRCEEAGFAVRPTGFQHGTVTVVVREGGAVRGVFEVTTLRRDVACDGRHAEVSFTDDWAEDARRRDFTMNALYCDAEGQVIDLVDGLADVRARRVRFVGDAAARIEEDFLRILRFFRIHARFGSGEPDAAGLAACTELRHGLKRISAERITTELLKTLVAPGVIGVIEAMARSGVLAVVGIAAPDVGRLARMVRIDAAHDLEPDGVLRLAVPAGSTHVQDARVRLSNEDRARMAALEDEVTVTPALDEAARRERLYRLGPARYRDAVRFAWSAAADDGGWPALLALAAAWTVPTFPVAGRDLVARGAEPGPAIGEALARLERRWIAEGFPPDKTLVLRWLEDGA